MCLNEELVKVGFCSVPGILNGRNIEELPSRDGRGIEVELSHVMDIS